MDILMDIAAEKKTTKMNAWWHLPLGEVELDSSNNELLWKKTFA